MIDSIGKIPWNYEVGSLARIIKKYYYWMCNIAEKRLQKLSTENAIVEIDFKSLDVVTESTYRSLYVNVYDEGLSADLYAWG